jgi:hypothetical protein
MGSLVLFIPSVAMAAPELIVGTARAFPGESVDVPFSVIDVTNAVAAQWDVDYDPAKVMLEDVVPGEGMSNHIVRAHEVAPGVHRVLAYSPVNETMSTTTDMVRASLRFTLDANEHVGSGPINPVNATLVRADSAVVPVALQAGRIFVAVGRYDPASGAVEFFLPSVPGSNYVIEATQGFSLWAPISTNMASSAFLHLFDTDATNYIHRFYRSWLVP